MNIKYYKHKNDPDQFFILKSLQDNYGIRWLRIYSGQLESNSYGNCMTDVLKHDLESNFIEIPKSEYLVKRLK
jgi:hypothetical protein